MNRLSELLRRRIAATGPLSLADYMAECLLHPEHGYYTRAEPFGAAGDFITAPEISQMFGELLGLWIAQAWLDQGAPAPFTLAEVGPGRGTLMADVLRATARVPGFHAAMRVVLVEASPRLRRVQREALSAHEVSWCETLADLPQAPLFLLANEFIDALPVRQFCREGEGWSETMVTEAGGALTLARGPAMAQSALAHRLADTREGDLVEICPLVPAVTQAIAARIARHGGAALIVDYGGWHSLGDTVQALSAHRPVDILTTPGEADLTAHVDFEPIAEIARAAGASAHGPVGQGPLLIALGIGPRAERLAQGLTGAPLEQHLAATRRLTHPEEMGNLFKALAILPPHAHPPAGFPQ